MISTAARFHVTDSLRFTVWRPNSDARTVGNTATSQSRPAAATAATPRTQPTSSSRHRPPVTAVTVQIREPVLQIVGVGLDRVRRLLDRRQIRQEPLHRLDRQLIVTEHRPRLELGLRHDNTLHPQLAPPAIPLRDGQPKVIATTTRIGDFQRASCTWWITDNQPQITDGMCASGPSIRSAKVVSMMAWRR